ncbi:hypothetical protein BDM02DRAFT_3114692 [Thelephora ganbajun]|uniref:Uncharacterized protein n=1 Tax=Thelephora ganbajun TaxID=370292 RepID=A0ACB6ZHB6_THEGA|nr:hypothetical protein BDM02DRAFT_3114692 [Thelephora ganbajun]
MIQPRLTWTLVIAACALPAIPIQAVDVSVPASPPNDATVVKGNFLGVSFELSAFDKYFGSNPSGVTTQTVNYLTSYNRLLSGLPLKIRIGGRSSENFTYVEAFGSEGEPKPSDGKGMYGPTVVNVLQSLSKKLGVSYLLNLSLKDPSGQGLTKFATTSKSVIQTIEGYTLGSGPDLYNSEGIRPSSSNYTVDNYATDYNTAFGGLKQLASGDLTASSNPLIAGPTISTWDLATVLQGNWFNSFKGALKYITLERPAPDVCIAVVGPIFNASHPNAVREGQWQQHGLSIAKGTGKPIILSQYSLGASDCNGNVTSTFTGTLWTVDYSLQLASVGYSAVYLHTMERGTPFNLFDYPEEGSSFTTRPVHYAYYPVLLALQSYNGSKVVDLNVDGATNGAYAVYDSKTSDLYRVVLINYAGSGTTFTLPKSVGGSNVTVGYLTAPSPQETSNIMWAGQTWQSSQDGLPTGKREYQSLACATGCDVEVPGPGAAVVMFNKHLAASEPNGGGSTGTDFTNPGNGTGNGGGSHNSSSKTAHVVFGDFYLVLFALISLVVLY